MTKEQIAKKLREGFDPSILTPNVSNNKESSWSYRFSCNPGEELQTLTKIFLPEGEELNSELFECAISGDGNELSKIMTLHSSSLIAFLCFSTAKMISIEGLCYTHVLFEVKNDVINAGLGNSSNVDILLMNEDRSELLFLESKFTEYLQYGHAYPSEEKYVTFYNALLNSEGSFPFKAGRQPVTHKPSKDHSGYWESIEYCLYEEDCKKPQNYLDGIKQLFSHLLGIATRISSNQASMNSSKYTEQLLNNATRIRFGTILNNCDEKKFDTYSNLYKAVFKESNHSIIKKALQTILPNSKTIEKLEILTTPLSYHDIFKNVELPIKVKQFYSL